jgi:hypothetical protein
MWRDSIFISEINTESVIFPDDIEGLTDFIEFTNFDHIYQLILLYLKMLGLN